VSEGRSRRELLAGAAVAAAGALAAAAFQERSAEAVGDTAELTAYAASPPGRAGRHGVRRIVWSVPDAHGLVALTFDDGPTARYTPRVLEILHAAGVAATFNVVGARALASPSILRDLVAAGHEIGNHTHHHEDLSRLDPRAVHQQLFVAQDAIQQCVQTPVTVFRPPRGELTGVAIREAAGLGLDVAMWSITRDVAGTGSVDAIVRSIVGRAGSGDILAMHDGLGHAGFRPASPMARTLRRQRDVELRALPHILNGLAERGLRPVTVTQLLRAGSDAVGLTG
jgi:peptidoglycan/xylan/chitin deacetylase (PgdA/CDA1 family)